MANYQCASSCSFLALNMFSKNFWMYLQKPVPRRHHIYVCYLKLMDKIYVCFYLNPTSFLNVIINHNLGNDYTNVLVWHMRVSYQDVFFHFTATSTCFKCTDIRRTLRWRMCHRADPNRPEQRVWWDDGGQVDVALCRTLMSTFSPHEHDGWWLGELQGMMSTLGVRPWCHAAARPFRDTNTTLSS